MLNLALTIKLSTGMLIIKTQKMRFFAIFIILNFSQLLIGQNNFQRCSANEHRHFLQQQNPAKIQQQENRKIFIKNYLGNHKEIVQNRAAITIPVVVHVVYKTEEENVSDAVIQSQIDALNEDFGMNNIEIDDVPNEFQNSIANVDIEFCLAQVDPNGNATTGIVRRETNLNQFNDQDGSIFYDNDGGSDSWPAEDYMNIWVCNLGSFLAGFATFPNDADEGEDGVVINYINFGRVGLDPPYHLGRTTTHEVGHFFGLEHVWGSGSATCSDDDGIADTPNTNTTYIGECPANAENSCSSNDMFMNFMYYTDDGCMAMFSEGQKAVMLANLDNFRAGLTTSLACSPLATIDQDLDNSLQIFPNPTTNLLYLQLDKFASEILTMTVFDNFGKPIYKDYFKNTIDVSDFSKGIYFLKMTTKNGIVTRKFVVQ
jgi:hypothetical protein